MNNATALSMKMVPMATVMSLSLALITGAKMCIRDRYNIIQRQLSAAGMSINELNQQIVIGSTEGIKQYLKHSDCYALVSVFSIQDELSCGLLKIIDIDDLEITRSLYAIHKQGTIDPYAELLLRFCESDVYKRQTQQSVKHILQTFRDHYA